MVEVIRQTIKHYRLNVYKYPKAHNLTKDLSLNEILIRKIDKCQKVFRRDNYSEFPITW
jgi:hypothetical protein